MSGRQKAYLIIRGSAAGLFLVAVFVMPRGVPAAVAAIVAGIGGILTCIGVNAGGPGEQAGARVEAQLREKVRPPQGDWPPYDEDRVIEGEIVPPKPR